VSRHVEAARGLIATGRTDLAERELRTALAQHPDDGAAHTLLSLCLTNEGRHDHALEASTAALRLLPDNSFVWRVRSVVFLNLGRAGDAEAAAQRAIGIDPDHAHAFIARGQARLLAGRRLEALADFDIALSLDPENAFAHDIRARTLTLVGRNEAAADAAAEALRLAPASPTAHAARAWQLLHAGDRDGARDEFRESLRLDPESNWARLGLVEALKARNPVYRFLLRGLLRMGRMGRRQAWIVIALLAAARVAGIATVDHGGAGTYVLAAVALTFLGFVVAAAARPLFNAVLRWTPDGRDLLTAAEHRESMLVAACVFAGALFAASWAVTGEAAFGLAGASTALLSILVVSATRMRGRRRRRIVWTAGGASVLAMFMGLGVALVADGGRLPSHSYVPVAIAAPILATFGTPLIRRRSRPAFRLPWRRARRRPAASEAPPAPRTSRWVTWPLTAIGLLAGMGLLGSLQGSERLGGLGLCAAGFGAAVAFPALRRVIRRARAASSTGTLVLLVTLAALTALSFAAVVTTRHVPAEGAFALALYLLAASALVLDADSMVRRRRLAAWVAACALLTAGCGLAALAGGHTQGPDAAFVGPLATWAGTGLFGLLLTPLLARIRSPRRLLIRS
jgi:lipoprotein NlpI